MAKKISATIIADTLPSGMSAVVGKYESVGHLTDSIYSMAKTVTVREVHIIFPEGYINNE